MTIHVLVHRNSHVLRTEFYLPGVGRPVGVIEDIVAVCCPSPTAETVRMIAAINAATEQTFGPEWDEQLEALV